MNSELELRRKILDEPSYWVESINNGLYDAIVNYMETNNLKRKDLATYLGLSRGRVSQILNDGEINFSIEKLVEIALKVNSYPIVEFQNKDEFIKNEHFVHGYNEAFCQFEVSDWLGSLGDKVIPISEHSRTLTIQSKQFCHVERAGA